jgi:hypothetical protein
VQAAANNNGTAIHITRFMASYLFALGTDDAADAALPSGSLSDAIAIAASKTRLSTLDL